MAITNQLDTVSTQLAALIKENGELRTKLHDISSVLANEVASAEDLEKLFTSVRDLAHRVSAPGPTAHTHPAAPAPQGQTLTDPGTLDPSVHQQKKFHLMYYIHISLYRLVIPPPLIPSIPPVVTSCSKGP